MLSVDPAELRHPAIDEAGALAREPADAAECDVWRGNGGARSSTRWSSAGSAVSTAMSHEVTGTAGGCWSPEFDVEPGKPGGPSRATCRVAHRLATECCATVRVVRPDGATGPRDR